MFFLAKLHGFGIFVPQPGIRPVPLQWKHRSRKPWTAREFHTSIGLAKKFVQVFVPSYGKIQTNILVNTISSHPDEGGDSCDGEIGDGNGSHVMVAAMEEASSGSAQWSSDPVCPSVICTPPLPTSWPRNSDCW